MKHFPRWNHTFIDCLLKLVVIYKGNLQLLISTTEYEKYTKSLTCVRKPKLCHFLSVRFLYTKTMLIKSQISKIKRNAAVIVQVIKEGITTSKCSLGT